MLNKRASAEDIILPLTVVTRGKVSAALTLSSLKVAVVAVAVTVAGPAVREAPEARPAVGTLAADGPRYTLTLACGLMAEGADRAHGVTLAS